MAMTVGEFDALDPASAAAVLRPVCASRAWSDAVVAARPFRTLATLSMYSDTAIANLDWTDVDDALAEHPRIGQRAARAGTEATWSAQEQAGAAGSGQDVAAALHAGNVTYEQRFGHVFLICATGRSASEMLVDLSDRLGNEPEAEKAVVRRELAAI